MNLLELVEVSKQYYQHKALDRVSIEIKEGSIFGLLGPNGAGKTTLIRIITQIIAPDEGKVLYKQKLMQEEDIYEMGYLPEERGLYKKMKVWDQLIYFARLKGIDSLEAIKRAKLWLNRLNIEQWKDKKVEDLSKGMQQKIQFIATILHQPKLLILDEPFSGFDPINAELIKNELLNMRKEGVTIILSTHNMNSVEELCDDIALIHQAKVVLKGNVNEIKKQFKSSIYIIQIKGHLQSFTHALWASAELLESKEIGNEWLVKIKLKEGFTINNVLQQVLPVCEIISLKEDAVSMNDIFIKVVSKDSPISATSILTE
ncbi:MAG: ABC transporter ATP-binding protein [Bacteroidia bacterium]|nr:MAG: ABC transporter ATP-binding protein [Bacteroidia bacterium]